LGSPSHRVHPGGTRRLRLRAGRPRAEHASGGSGQGGWGGGPSPAARHCRRGDLLQSRGRDRSAQCDRHTRYLGALPVRGPKVAGPGDRRAGRVQAWRHEPDRRQHGGNRGLYGQVQGFPLREPQEQGKTAQPPSSYTADAAAATLASGSVGAAPAKPAASARWVQNSGTWWNKPVPPVSGLDEVGLNRDWQQAPRIARLMASGLKQRATDARACVSERHAWVGTVSTGGGSSSSVLDDEARSSSVVAGASSLDSDSETATAT